MRNEQTRRRPDSKRFQPLKLTNLHILQIMIITSPQSRLEIIKGYTAEDKKNLLVRMNLLDLNSWTSSELNAFCGDKFIQIKHKTIDPVTGKTGQKSFNKSEVMEALKAYVIEEKATRLINAEIDRSVMYENGFQIEQFAPAVDNLHGDELVERVIALLSNRGFADSTIVKTYLPDVLKYIHDNYKGDDIKEVRGGVNKYFLPILKRVNAGSKLTVYDKNIGLRQLDAVDYYTLMIELLTSESSGWKELSYGIVMATGRRCSEIHNTKTSFVPVHENTVTFTGQLKTKSYTGKGVESTPYSIPTLADSTLVATAYARLRTFEKRIFDSPEDSHRKLSKALSGELQSTLKTRLTGIGINMYKDCRTAYALLCQQQWQPVTLSDNAYIGRIMGHSANDLVTAATYNTFFLKEDIELTDN